MVMQTGYAILVWLCAGYSGNEHAHCLPRRIHKSGDVVIGGMFPFHTELERIDDSLLFGPLRDDCLHFNEEGYRLAEAMMFAIDEVNRNTTFVPGISLGYDIRDSCGSVAPSAETALDFISPFMEGEDTVKAVVGASRSSVSTAVSTIFGKYNIPFVSHGSTSTLLSKYLRYKSFFRTIPSDKSQSRAMVEIIERYGWEWIGTIATDDDYGRPGVQQVIDDFEGNGGCVAFSELLPTHSTPKRVTEIVDLIRTNPSVKVLVTFIQASGMRLILQEAARQNITDRIWIACETWSDNPDISKDLHTISDGSIGVVLSQGNIPHFADYLKTVTPFNENQQNTFLTELWEHTFQCKMPNARVYDIEAAPSPNCTTNMMFEETRAFKQSHYRITYNVYLAVRAIAQALHNIATCEPQSGLLQDGGCPNITLLEPWQLLRYIREVNFTGTDGVHYNFDDNEQGQGRYEINNWQITPDESIRLVPIGIFDGGASDGQKLQLDDELIKWNSGDIKAPESVCSHPCPLGTRKAILDGQPHCCFECVPCADGEIANATGKQTQRHRRQRHIQYKNFSKDMSDLKSNEERQCSLEGERHTTVSVVTKPDKRMKTIEGDCDGPTPSESSTIASPTQTVSEYDGEINVVFEI
uniref:Extracellular calcium-sensing receptor-like n=1 Tax=Saccoglossus kowalevskii TaxID=10224 RepID=A0ABM0MV65_SACKO|nr:PREDICTED: extracellular calcium-sensing receptor-like [Saccoglossus kowalevskii]